MAMKLEGTLSKSSAMNAPEYPPASAKYLCKCGTSVYKSSFNGMIYNYVGSGVHDCPYAEHTPNPAPKAHFVHGQYHCNCGKMIYKNVNNGKIYQTEDYMLHSCSFVHKGEAAQHILGLHKCFCGNDVYKSAADLKIYNAGTVNAHSCYPAKGPFKKPGAVYDGVKHLIETVKPNEPVVEFTNLGKVKFLGDVKQNVQELKDEFAPHPCPGCGVKIYKGIFDHKLYDYTTNGGFGPNTFHSCSYTAMDKVPLMLKPKSDAQVAPQKMWHGRQKERWRTFNFVVNASTMEEATEKIFNYIEYTQGKQDAARMRKLNQLSVEPVTNTGYSVLQVIQEGF